MIRLKTAALPGFNREECELGVQHKLMCENHSGSYADPGQRYDKAHGMRETCVRGTKLSSFFVFVFVQPQ